MNNRFGIFSKRVRKAPSTNWVVAGVLVAAFVLTKMIGSWDEARLESLGSEHLLEWQENAYQEIEESLVEVLSSLRLDAELIARSPEIIEGFRERVASPLKNEKIIRTVASIELKESSFLEIYDYAPTLLAWAGPVFPMDSGVSAPKFLAEPIERVVKDGSKRTALVVWVPVLDGEKILGAVRLGKVVESFMPIKNDYLRDYSWNEEWSKRLKTPVVFEFGEHLEARDPSERLLAAKTGTIFGRVSITQPSPQSLQSDRAQKYDDIQVFWSFLFVLWLIVVTTGTMWAKISPLHPQEDAATPPSLIGWFGTYLAGLIVARWFLLVYDIPARWQMGKSPLAPLFDPQHLASEFGFGALRTIGDLFITAVFITLAGLVFLRLTAQVRLQIAEKLHFEGRHYFRIGTGLVILGHVIIAALFASFLFQLSTHTILDSTLDFFARSGLLPERMILVIFGSLLMIVFTTVLVGGRLVWMLLNWSKQDASSLPSILTIGSIYLVSAFVVGFIFISVGWSAPLEIFAVILLAMIVSARINPVQPAKRSPIVALRHIVPLVMVTSILLFPMLEVSADEKTHLNMKDAALSFMEDQDSRIMFAISQVLTSISSSGFQSSYASIGQSAEPLDRAKLDSLAEETTGGFLLSAMAGYDVTVTLHALDGQVLGRYSSLIRRVPRTTRDEADKFDFELFSEMYREFGQNGPMIEKLTGLNDENRFRYTGFQLDPQQGAFYTLVRAEQRIITESAGAPFPRVLSPTGYYGNRDADLSIAQFQDGILIRSQGRNFGRSFLEEGVLTQLRSNPELWLEEGIRDRAYHTYYRMEETLDSESHSSVIAVRRRTTNIFDKLYHLLRIVVAGMFLVLPVYVGGIVWRLKNRQSDPELKRFRDQVLNAFFSVGIITVFAMGFVGMGVVTGENDRAIDSWLRQHLDRVEETLQLDTSGEELPYHVLERTDVDSLSARVGLDLVIYRGIEVEQASRPELIRDRLIERRLPIGAFSSLYLDGFRFVAVNENLGHFEYTAGFRTLTDEKGLPKYVISIPTLPEQERIEEERARTVAYLFGSLLLLVLVVMVTASLLANALTRPIAQLRAGLQAVAAGHFERIAQIGTQDEIAGLVDSFNTMQDQLEESQRLIGQQERQLAWKEMARQVAHEIKNPLTPMKLSIQHLRSAYSRRSENGSDEDKFSAKFNQTTTTLIEQIDTLARIANEFSSFGRMPTHIREEVDLNAVISEAVELMQAEDNVEIQTRLSPDRYIVEADREALRRVYINFLKNAIQAVPEERIAKIVVTSQAVLEDKKWFVLSEVIDNGTGIPRNLWEKIFVPSFSTKTSGTGLGLAIARKTIENMDGEIGFTTQFEHGSTFWIKVPLNQTGN